MAAVTPCLHERLYMQGIRHGYSIAGGRGARGGLCAFVNPERNALNISDSQHFIGRGGHALFTERLDQHFVEFTGFVVAGYDAPAHNFFVSGEVIAFFSVNTVVTAALRAVRNKNGKNILFETNTRIGLDVFLSTGVPQE